MKIGLVCPYNVTLGGAVKEIVHDLQDGLIARGHDVVILTPKPQGSDGQAPQGMIFIGNGGDFKSPLHTTAQLSAAVDTDYIDQIMEREQFDVLHFHEPWVPVLSRQILARSQAVNIATFHAKLPETVVSRTLAKVVTPYTKSVLKYLHTLTAVSDAAAEYVGMLTDDPVTIIPNGIDLSRFKSVRQQRRTSEVKTLLYVGRLERRKGVKYLLQAYEQLAQQQDNIQLIIAGDGPDREKLEAYAQSRMLPNVTFLGFVSDDVKMELLQSADLFCAPAIYGESFGIVLLEAMACGLVTVAGNNSGYTSVMRETGAISLVDPHDTDSFARRIQLLLNDESLRADWKRWAKQYVKQFDYELITDRYEDLYQYTLEHHSHHVHAYED